MKGGFPIVVTAFLAAAATAGLTEWLRSPNTPQPRAEPVVSGKSEPGRTVEPREAALFEQPATIAHREDLPREELRRRLDELEARLALLEATAQGGSRTRAEPPAGESGDSLREQVFDWIAEERDARARDARTKNLARQESELEFQARYQAYDFAREHGLEDWQRDRWAELFLEFAQRAQEIEDDIDIASDDPGELEARWAEYDEWVDDLERALTLEITPELYDELYGEE